MATKFKDIAFIYEGITKSGTKTSGVIEARTMNLARTKIEREGIRITKIKKQPLTLFQKAVKTTDVTIITRQMATMASAGVPLIKSFDTIIDGIQKHPGLKSLLLKMKSDLESGESLSNTIRKYPQHFDRLYCSLVAAGEESGTLDTMLDRIASQREKVESIKKKVRKALTYPAVVMVIAVAVTFILLAFAVPAFTGIFEQAGAELPLITQFTVAASEVAQKYWWVALAFVAIAFNVFRTALKKSTKFQTFVDYALLKIPIIGKIIAQSSLARFARTLETTLESGMTLTNALQAVSSATGNMKYENATLVIKDAVEKGESFTTGANECGDVFPNLMIQMISIGEESGNMSQMLNNVATIYEEEVDNLVGALSSMLEPIIMIVLGGIVGFLVISMYMPMFQLGDAIS